MRWAMAEELWGLCRLQKPAPPRCSPDSKRPSLLYMLGNCPPQPLISLREKLYTEHFFLFFNDLIFYCVFHLQLCTVFNQHHSKEWPCFVDGEELCVWGCELLLDSRHSESCLRDVTHADAHIAPDTERSDAVNSPDSMVLASFLSEEQLWSLSFWMSIVWQWHLLKTPGNLKTTVDVARDFHIAILVNTTRGLTL